MALELVVALLAREGPGVARRIEAITGPLGIELGAPTGADT